MKQITSVLVGVLFIIVIASAAISFKLYKDCSDKIDSSARQSRLLNEKMDNFEIGLDGLKLNLETLKTDIQGISLKSVQVEEIKKDIDGIKKEIQDIKTVQEIQAGYAVQIQAISDKIDALNKKIEEGKKEAAKKVDLGEISVKKEQAPGPKQQ